MKRFGAILALNFLFVANLANALQTKNSANLKDVEAGKISHKVTGTLQTTEYKLPNGLTVFLTENPSAPNIRVSHWVKAGSLHEKPGTTGIAHLFEHMMFRPLKPGAPSFFDIATKLGGDLNANTRFESTYFFTAVAPDKIKTLLKHESDRFKNLVVTKELLDVERKAVWSEYSTKFDANPIIDLWFYIYKQAFPGHPFGWTIIGEREDLEKITAEDCNAFFKKYYNPSNVGLFITGNFKSADILKLVVEDYGDWAKGEASALPPPFEGNTKEIIAEGKLPSQGNFVLAGFRTPYINAENTLVQSLVNYILFDSTSGLFKKRLVDQEKIAAAVEDFNFDYDNGMQKAGMVLLPTTKIPQLKTQVLKIKDDFKNMSEETFNIYKRNLFVAAAESMQRNSQLGDQLALMWGKSGDIDLISKFVTAPVDVKKEQAQKFMDQYYTKDNFIYLTHKGQSGVAK